MKICGVLVVVGGLRGLGAARADCVELRFDDADVCVEIDKISSNRFEVELEVLDRETNYLSLSCDIALPNGSLLDLGRCDGEDFVYSRGGEGEISLYITVNGEMRSLREDYDFDRGERVDSWDRDRDSDWDDEDRRSRWDDLDDFAVVVDPRNPREDERVDVEIRALDDRNRIFENYEGRVEFDVEYRTARNGSWRNAPGNYFDLARDFWDFDERDDGRVEIRDLVRFETDRFDFRLILEDERENVRVAVTFEFLESDFYDWDDRNSRDDELDDFEIRVEPRDPREDEGIDVEIRAVDDRNRILEKYRGEIEFEVEYRSSRSSSWRRAPSSLVDLDRDDFRFSSRDDGEVELRDLVRFADDRYEYRLWIEDRDARVRRWVEFDLDGRSSSWNDRDRWDSDFSREELMQIENLLDDWTILVRTLERGYDELDRSATRDRRQRELREEMENIVDGDRSEFEDFGEFMDAFIERYQFTVQLIS